METWVLILMVIGAENPQPLAITTIPGYRSKAECTIAAGALFEKPTFQKTMTWYCIPGPKK
ncbi:hypothetical protein AC628_23190 [Bradyrhizobium sp. NAS96.2]|nr:hypothetical protein AC628_23190 [Bradyrhizobium sp. NAS96.2]